MRAIILASIAVLTLSACGAQPLRTKEEAAIEAAAGIKVGSVPTPNDENVPLLVLTDSETGCQYLVAKQHTQPVSGLTPRMGYHLGSPYQLGCKGGVEL